MFDNIPQLTNKTHQQTVLTNHVINSLHNVVSMKAMVRSNLEYATTVWNPHYEGLIKNIKFKYEQEN